MSVWQELADVLHFVPGRYHREFAVAISSALAQPNIRKQAIAQTLAADGFCFVASLFCKHIEVFR